MGKRVADEGCEEDMLPSTICGNCLGPNDVRFDAASGRRLCAECEPNPRCDEHFVIRCQVCPDSAE